MLELRIFMAVRLKNFKATTKVRKSFAAPGPSHGDDALDPQARRRGKGRVNAWFTVTG